MPTGRSPTRTPTPSRVVALSLDYATNSHGRKLQLALCALFTLVLSRRTSVSVPCASKLIAGYGVVGGSTVDLPAAALPHAMTREALNRQFPVERSTLVVVHWLFESYADC